MYELVAQGCFENPALFEKFQRLQLHSVAPGCGSGPRRHAGAAHKVASRLVDDDLEARKARLQSSRCDTSEQLIASRLKQAEHVFNVSCIECLRVNHAEVRTAACREVTAILIYVSAGKVMRENLLIRLSALGHHVRAFLAQAETVAKATAAKYKLRSRS